jgi:hypothetical protein
MEESQDDDIAVPDPILPATESSVQSPDTSEDNNSEASSEHHSPVPANADAVDVAAILAHKGKPKKRTRMQFHVRWRGFDDAHNQWLPWSELKNNWVLHI